MITTSSSLFPLSDGCPYCAFIVRHAVEVCPNVSEIEYRKDGTVKRVVKTRYVAPSYLAPLPIPPFYPTV